MRVSLKSRSTLLRPPLLSVSLAETTASPTDDDDHISSVSATSASRSVLCRYLSDFSLVMAMAITSSGCKAPWKHHTPLCLPSTRPSLPTCYHSHVPQSGWSASRKPLPPLQHYTLEYFDKIFELGTQLSPRSVSD